MHESEIIGFNARMTDIHAAIGREQLTKVDAWTKTCQANVAFLDANLHGVVTPPVAERAVHVYHQYTIRVPEDRDGFVAAWKAERARSRPCRCSLSQGDLERIITAVNTLTKAGA